MNLQGWKLHPLTTGHWSVWVNGNWRLTFAFEGGDAGISPEMARRIEAWLGREHGGSAEVWLGMQMDYDLWQAEQQPAPKVERAPVEKLTA